MWSWIRLFFSAAVKAVIYPLATLLVSRLGKELWDICLMAVQMVEEDMGNLTNPEKREQCIAIIKSELERRGKEVRGWLVNLFLEMAVGFVKGYF